MWYCREYVKITKDWPLEAAKAFAGLKEPFKFVYVSGKVSSSLTLFPITNKLAGEGVSQRQQSFIPTTLPQNILTPQRQLSTPATSPPSSVASKDRPRRAS